MTYSYQEIQGKVIALNEFKIPRAKSIAFAALKNPAYYLNPVFIKRGDNSEVILLKLDIEIYQSSLNGIQEQEDIAIICHSEDEYFPEVYALRSDFKLGLPHTNLRIESHPVSLCVSEQSFVEVKHRFNSFEFIESIRRWMSLTSLGKLHAYDQPLEPFFNTKNIVVVPEPGKVDFNNFHLEKYTPNSSLYKIRSKVNDSQLYFCMPLSVDERTSGFIHRHPQAFKDLMDIISIKGIDISTFLSKLFDKDSNDLLANKNRLKQRLAICCFIPVKRHSTDTKSEKTDILFFATKKNISEIGIESGVWGESPDGNSLVKLVGKSFSKESFQNIEIELFYPIDDFTRSNAAIYNNLKCNEDRFTLIGVGALGSQVIAQFARIGFGYWNIIDYDTLLPHNLARHFLNRDAVGHAKVDKLAEELNLLVGDKFCYPINVNFITKHKSYEIVSKLKESKAIIDISTSIAVERILARDYGNDISTRRISTFLNPSGLDLIILAEDAKRNHRLDFLEMEYYRFLFRNKKLNKHLVFDEELRIRYNRNSCREISSRINQTDIAIHASICAKAIMKIVVNREAIISIWSINPKENTVQKYTITPTKWGKFTASDWKIYLNKQLLEEMQIYRQKKLPKETGGVLLGSIDSERKVIYIYDTIPAPEDSKETTSSFERGVEGVLDEYKKYQKITDNQVQYLGEWHSHPKRYSSNPSTFDINLFAYLLEKLSRQGYPTIMGIIGDLNSTFTISC